jgi:hypothetical protein
MEKGFNKRDLILATRVEEQRMSIKEKYNLINSLNPKFLENTFAKGSKVNLF